MYTADFCDWHKREKCDIWYLNVLKTTLIRYVWCKHNRWLMAEIGATNTVGLFWWWGHFKMNHNRFVQ